MKKQMLGVMLLCGSLLFGCQAGQETQENYDFSYKGTQARSAMTVIETIKKNGTNEEYTLTDSFSFQVLVELTKQDGFTDAELTGYSFKHNALVLTAPKGDKVGKEWYNELTTKKTVKQFGKLEELETWELYSTTLDTQKALLGEDSIRVYVEFPDSKGNIVAVMEWWNLSDESKLIEIY